MESRRSPLTPALLLIDLAATAGSFFAADQLRGQIQWPLFQQGYDLENHLWVLFFSLLFTVVIAPIRGLYTPLRLTSSLGLARRHAAFSITEILVLAAIIFFFKTLSVSRAFILLFLGLKAASLIGIRVGYILLSRVFRSRQYNYRRALIISSSSDAGAIERSFSHSNFGNVYIAALIPPKNLTLSSLLAQLKETPVDDCFLDCAPQEIESFESIFQCLEDRGICLHFKITLPGSDKARFRVEYLGDQALLSSTPALLSPEAMIIKRSLDILFSLIGIALTSLLYPFIALAIKMDSHGPVLFRQTRVGQNGRRFKCYKFRTMVVDAEEQKAALTQNNEINGPMFKITRDPRVTRVGAWLRKTSLDEFPQFINVLRGEMSLIGTRPPTPNETDQYTDKDFRRISIKPGLTGLWQVSGRSKITNFNDVVKLDLQYIDQWSLWLDFKIILRTVWSLLSRRGAA